MRTRNRPSSRSLASPIAFCLVVVGVALPAVPSAGILVGHLMLVALSPVLIAHAGTHRYLKWLWVVMTVWAASQLLADLIASGSPSSLVVLSPVIALGVSALHWLVTRYNVPAALLTLAIGVGWMLHVLQDLGPLLATGNPWKYGLSAPVALTAVSLVSALRGGRLALGATLIALAAVSFASDSRISTGVLAIAAILCVVSTRSEGSNRSRIFVLMVSAAALVVVLYLIYPSVALSGVIGERALAEQQTFDRSGANFLLGARKEVWQTLYLIANNPLSGIGGYSPVSGTQSLGALDFIEQNIVPLNVNDINYLVFAESGLGYHPHSQLLESVLYAGIGALPAWGFILGSAAVLVVREIRGVAPLPGLQSYLALGAIWAAFFSPIGPLTSLSLTVILFIASLGPAVHRRDSASSILKLADSSAPDIPRRAVQSTGYVRRARM